MQEFFKNLMSKSKNSCLPEEFNFFGKLIGGWEIDYINNSNSSLIKGTWHFSWILDGMAIQDVINLPNYELGTTLRIYNPVTNAWDIAYCYMGRIMRFEARKQGDKIVLTNIDDERRKLRMIISIGKTSEYKTTATGRLILTCMQVASIRF